MSQAERTNQGGRRQGALCSVGIRVSPLVQAQAWSCGRWNGLERPGARRTRSEGYPEGVKAVLASETPLWSNDYVLSDW